MLKLIGKKNTPEIFTCERCHITELLNDESSPGLSMARCRVERGVTTQLHALKATAEVYYIESGTGTMDDGENESFAVRAGDAISIAPDHPQRITNTGEGDLVFVVICRPRFVPGCYVNLEVI